ncbi:MAG: dihydropteroate synthase [Alphaproteobacteria bacterium]|nr:dihydropteroate synthase [Alphaproteobacteria bacterium]
MAVRGPLPDLGKRSLIMGIVNVTPDSFSGDGLLLSEDYVRDATQYALQMIEDGADILDIGGESTRPGAKPLLSGEEIRRISPVISAIHKARPDIPLSIDTMKYDVACVALEAGASLINDISGHGQDPRMRRLAADKGGYLVLMHNEACARDVTQTRMVGGEYLAKEERMNTEDVARDLMGLATTALEDGVSHDRIILDPGIGFGKTLEQNLALINQLDHFAPLGFPVLLGASRKSFIGRVLDLPAEARLEGTAATVAVGTMRGASILRVHDVRFMSRVVRMTHALMAAG